MTPKELNPGIVKKKLHIQLFAPQAKPGPVTTHEVNEGTTIEGFLEQLEIKELDNFLILVNSRPSKLETELKDSDLLSIVLLLDGG